MLFSSVDKNEIKVRHHAGKFEVYLLHYLTDVVDFEMKRLFCDSGLCCCWSADSGSCSMFLLFRTMPTCAEQFDYSDNEQLTNYSLLSYLSGIDCELLPRQ